MKSFRPKDGSGEPPAGGGRDREADFHGQKRSNETHASTTGLEARQGPARKPMGHAMMENRNGLVVDACLTEANRHAERIAAPHMIEPRAARPRPITLGADKGHDAEDFVDELRSMKCDASPCGEHERSLVGDRRPHDATRGLRGQPPAPQPLNPPFFSRQRNKPLILLAFSATSIQTLAPSMSEELCREVIPWRGECRFQSTKSTRRR
jgi:hypothetical protein